MVVYEVTLRQIEHPCMNCYYRNTNLLEQTIEYKPAIRPDDQKQPVVSVVDRDFWTWLYVFFKYDSVYRKKKLNHLTFGVNKRKALEADCLAVMMFS